MNIKVLKELSWYSATIEEYWIFTQWDTFEELLKNINEAIELYNESDSYKNFLIKNEFNLSI